MNNDITRAAEHYEVMTAIGKAKPTREGRRKLVKDPILPPKRNHGTLNESAVITLGKIQPIPLKTANSTTSVEKCRNQPYRLKKPYLFQVLLDAHLAWKRYVKQEIKRETKKQR
jgi:hypothetical protein